jgi:Transcriptional regulators
MAKTPEKFKKLNKENLSDQIIYHIKEMIEQEVLKPGEVLPSERELAIKLGVSRLPLREALKTLQFINVLEGKPGKGYIVKGLTVANLLDILDEACESGQPLLNDLKEMRITVEVRAVELACVKRTEKDLEKMLTAIKDMENELNHSDARLIKSSIDFHNSVLKASHNKFFVAILATFSDAVHAGRRRSLTIKDRYKLAIDEHKNIYLAIKARDAQNAVRLMRSHLETGYSDINETCLKNQ